jgi:hypothetical protein
MDINVDIDSSWLEKIKKIKSCMEIWKSRDLTYEGKFLILKSFVLSLIGYEIELSVKLIIYSIFYLGWENKQN